MIIAQRKMSYQIGENDFDIVTETKTFDDSATVADIRKWHDELNTQYHFYASPEVKLQFK